MRKYARCRSISTAADRTVDLCRRIPRPPRAAAPRRRARRRRPRLVAELLATAEHPTWSWPGPPGSRSRPAWRGCAACASAASSPASPPSRPGPAGTAGPGDDRDPLRRPPARRRGCLRRPTSPGCPASSRPTTSAARTTSWCTSRRPTPEALRDFVLDNLTGRPASCTPRPAWSSTPTAAGTSCRRIAVRLSAATGARAGPAGGPARGPGPASRRRAGRRRVRGAGPPCWGGRAARRRCP